MGHGVLFSTTKPCGTGLGLLVSQGIVQEHGGRITVESKMDERRCRYRMAVPLEQQEG